MEKEVDEEKNKDFIKVQKEREEKGREMLKRGFAAVDNESSFGKAAAEHGDPRKIKYIPGTSERPAKASLMIPKYFDLGKNTSVTVEESDEETIVIFKIPKIPKEQ